MIDHVKLIAFVRSYDALFDKSHPKYNDALYKDKIWNDIGLEFDETGEACKKSWFYLRDSFRRATRRRNDIKSRQSGGKMKKWKYEEHMSFLQPYTSQKSAKAQLDMVISGDVNHLKSRKLKYIQQQTVSAVDYLLQNIETDSGRSQENDRALKKFFDSMSETVNGFSKRNQHTAKSRIFAIVSELELEELTEKDNQAVNAENQMYDSKYSYNLLSGTNIPSP